MAWLFGSKKHQEIRVFTDKLISAVISIHKGNKMLKKGKRIRKKHSALAVGICFEPLEPRLLLSGSWGAGVDASSEESQANAPGGFGQETVALHADAGLSDPQAWQHHRLQIQIC